MPRDHIKQLLTAYDIEVADVNDQRPPQVLICIHGIRDNPGWSENFKTIPGFIEEKIIVEKVNYGRMSSFQFLFGNGREKFAEDAIDQIREIKANYQNSPISIICHSNGTKLVSEIIEKVDIEINWLFLCGSVCTLNDARKLRSAQRRPIVNEIGSRDWWPILAEAIRPHLFQATGVYGFMKHPILDRQFDFHHGGGLKKKHIEEWILPVLTTGRPVSIVNNIEPNLIHFPVYIRRFAISLLSFIMILAIIFLS